MTYQPLSFRGIPTYPEVAEHDRIYTAGFFEKYDWRRYRQQHGGGLLPIPPDVMEYRKSLADKVRAIKAADKQYGVVNTWTVMGK